MPRADASRRRCAIYTRKSSEEGLEQEFNSLAAQREACEAYIRSQQHEGWLLAWNRYDDGGFSGGNLERPAAQRLLTDIRAGRIDIVVVYKVDRLTRAAHAITRRQEGPTALLSGPRGDHVQPERTAMPRADASRRRCAIYTRKSSEEGLKQEFNSLAAQREACEEYIRSQQHEGWLLARNRYDDGGFCGGHLQ